ncbi:hypothetical protein ACNKHP_08145 [Shigella boydii]
MPAFAPAAICTMMRRRNSRSSRITPASVTPHHRAPPATMQRNAAILVGLRRLAFQFRSATLDRTHAVLHKITESKY